MADPLRIVVTGATRGLGLELVRQYAAEGQRVFALVRDPEGAGIRAAAASGDVSVHGCDVCSADGVYAAAAAVGAQTDSVDLLINNAGIAGRTGSRLGELDAGDLRAVLEVNAIAPLRVTEAFLPLLRRGRAPRVVHVTSRMGSIADNESGGWWAYRMSKAALNMACKNMALELRPEGIATMVVHPGWVRTDMGGSGAPLSAEESVRGMRVVIDELDLASSGVFRDWSGAELPW